MTEAESTAISRLRASEIMTKSVRTATRGMSLREVAAMMRDGDVGLRRRRIARGMIVNKYQGAGI